MFNVREGGPTYLQLSSATKLLRSQRCGKELGEEAVKVVNCSRTTIGVKRFF